MATRDISIQVNDTDIFKADLTSTANIQYYGFAAAGTVTSAASWKIYVLDLDVNGVPIGKRFAAASAGYINIWDNRTSLVYS